MGKPIIEVSGLSKEYRLGTIGSTSIRELLEMAASRTRAIGRRCVHLVGRQNLRSNSEPLISDSDHTLWAIKDISFAVNEGEIVGVVGINGSGKSTLLRILSRITTPTSGYAILRGNSASLLEVGTGFHAELTGRENIYLNGAILGMSRREITRKFDEIVAFSEIEPFIDTPVKRYSSGMYVRLGFSVAAHLETRILMLDEVLAVGDAGFRAKCLRKTLSMAKDGRTVLFVSHDATNVMQLCNWCVLLDHGRIKKTGTTTEIMDHYKKICEYHAKVRLQAVKGG